MATVTDTLKSTGGKINMREFLSAAMYNSGESIGDMVITVVVTGMALVWMATHAHPVLVEIIAPYYITGMLIALLIRIVHRFDSSWTTDEIGDRIIELDAKVDERLQIIERNI